jgi:Fuc2NAc and GlcNAc transferase
VNAMVILTSLLACVWLSWYITRRFVLFAMEQQLLDVPNSRSSHTVITPRGGGVSFVVVLLGATIVLTLLHRIPFLLGVGLLTGGFVALVGYLDDRRGMSIRTRLMVQLCASAVAIYCLFGVPVAGTPAIRLLILGGFVAAILSFTWLINLFNFMDGIDGLAASEAACVASVCFALSVMHSGFHEVSLLFGVFAGAIIGFLVWNWHPAHIFMGDAGSCFLGFSLGALALLGARREELSPWVPFILIGVFAIDATITLARRMLRGERWYKPHCLHAFQHASKAFGHSSVTTAVIAINLLWLTPWAVLAQAYPRYGLLLLLGAWSPLIVLAYLFHAGEVLCKGAMPRWRTGLLIVNGTAAPGGNPVVKFLRTHARRNMPIYRAVQIAMVSMGCAYIALLSEGEGIQRTLTPNILALTGLFTVLQIATLLAFGLHRSHWRFISIEEVPNIIGMALTATLFGVLGAVAITGNSIGLAPDSALVLDALLFVVALVMLQMLAVAISRFAQTDSSDTSAKRVVIYGADAAGVSISSDLRRLGTGYRIVGFVDGRKAMRGIQIAGGHVLGADYEIRKLVDTYKVDQVLISSTSMRSESGQSFARHCRSVSVDFRVIPSVENGFKTKPEATHASAEVYL